MDNSSPVRGGFDSPVILLRLLGKGRGIGGPRCARSRHGHSRFPQIHSRSRHNFVLLSSVSLFTALRNGNPRGRGMMGHPCRRVRIRRGVGGARARALGEATGERQAEDTAAICSPPMRLSVLLALPLYCTAAQPLTSSQGWCCERAPQRRKA